MKTIRVLFEIMLVMSGMVASAQSYIPITNNMQIGNDANIKFAAGNYAFTDPEADGVIQISNKHNIILDGDSCRVNGSIFQGYMIKITNSHNITIRNFDSVYGYRYAVYILNSDHITINGNVFSSNKVDSSGWIDVWADYTLALGGGVMMYQSRAAHIYNNVMNLQNDGVALYHCDSIRIHDNDFSWNTSYGIRMFWTDTCNIYQNNCSHVNRPLTDPSDCAALLMIVSNANRIENNDLSWSGDGVFLGQYQHSDIQNNNYIAWNECSYSPHNAIEATFAYGNIYKHNKCNASDYGMWLGYSFNSLVDSNEVTGNYHSGIAIDRGYSNSVSHNEITDNPTGIELWEGSPITGYSNQHSKDYHITNNTFTDNSIALSALKTAHTVIIGNEFNYSQTESLHIDQASAGDTVIGNTFRMPTAWHIRNLSPNAVYAPGNLFIPSDTAIIAQKIYDFRDNSTKGEVVWYPQTPGPNSAIQSQPPCDMAEPLSTWYVYPETGYPAKNRFPDSLSFDSVQKVVGAASVKLVTSRGYDLALNYRPFNDSLSRWSLTVNDTLYFWIRTIKQPQYGFQYFSIRLGDSRGNYYKYTASSGLLNQANNVWKHFKFPLSGNSQFLRTIVGNMSLDSVNYVEIHADTWDYGFTLWVDGLQFSDCSPVVGIAPFKDPGITEFFNYPNPFYAETTITYFIPEPGPVKLEVFDMQGTFLATLINENQPSGEHTILFSRERLLLLQSAASPMLLIRLLTTRFTQTRKMVQLK